MIFCAKHLLAAAKGIQMTVFSAYSSMEAAARYFFRFLSQKRFYQPRGMAISLGSMSKPSELPLAPGKYIACVIQATGVESTSGQLDNCFASQTFY
jgi:hypothetical protein